MLEKEQETVQEHDPQESFGEFLKRERNMRGVTLEEISRNTNINLKFLEALENDDHEELPPEVFVKGFLKAYSKCIGVDANEIILAYSEHVGTIGKDQGTDKKIKFVEKDRNQKMLVMTFFIFCVFFIGIYYITTSKKDVDIKNVKKETLGEKKEFDLQKSTKTESRGPEGSKEGKKKVELVVPSTKKVKPVEALSKSSAPDSDPQKSQSAIETGEPFKLTIYASDNLWLKIGIDDIEPKEALLNEGEQVTYEAEEKFLLTLGNIKGSIVSLNGQDFMLPDKKNNVLRDFEITRDSLEREE